MEGKAGPLFIESVAMNSRHYCDNVLAVMLHDIERQTSEPVLMQDGAPSHTSGETVRYLQERCRNFIKPYEWPANSPDLNPLAYSIWGWLESKVHEGERVTTVDQLERKISEAWEQMDPSSITKPPPIGEDDSRPFSMPRVDIFSLTIIDICIVSDSIVFF
jgi:hypothetical protein